MATRLTFILVLVFIITGCGHDEPIPPAPASNPNGTLTAKGAAWNIQYVYDGELLGSDMSFQDVVAAVHIAKSGQWYLSFGAPYPNQDLSVWVPKSYTRKTRQDWFLGLKGKVVRVEGRAQAYRGKPELVVNDLDLIVEKIPPIIEPSVFAKPIVKDQPKVEVANSKPVSKEAASIKTTPIFTVPSHPIDETSRIQWEWVYRPEDNIFTTTPSHSLDKFGYRHSVRCKLFKASEKCDPKAGSSGCSYCLE